MTSLLIEPSPLWPIAPRYSSRPFPPYRFTPGLNKHPTALPEGHSYGHDIANEIKTHMPISDWKKNDVYLYGIDLYHQGYLWESHEAWEALWHLTKKTDAEGQFLQGLIQNSAALLKIHLKQWAPARHLSHEAWERLCAVLDSAACIEPKNQFMGIDLEKLLQGMQSYYKSLWESKKAISNSPPLLILSL
ncbi:MAG: DUF309 domain-containing protein [Deltaproteobacteria bacterium]|nr:MAG: DUF309 domain-containing protein [Deltaproteobacteria bacterium]